MEELVSELDTRLKNHALKIVTKNEVIERSGSKNLKLNFILGYGGRAEITDAIKEIAKSVREGGISPEDVGEDEIEKHLRIKTHPI